MSTDVPPDPAPAPTTADEPIALMGIVNHQILDSNGNPINVHSFGTIMASPMTGKKVEAPTEPSPTEPPA